MEIFKKKYQLPVLTILDNEFEDILLVSIVEDGNDIFDFDEEL